MSEFVLETDAIDLPKGAWAKTSASRLRFQGNTVFGLIQGSFRNYVFPLMTPAGYCVTAECPADHPHHSSLWIGSDHVHALMPAANGSVEEYTYNFYVNETFQGRAPGRIVQAGQSAGNLADGRFQIEQQFHWIGPSEWGAAEGRLIADEQRILTVAPGERRTRIDVSSRLSCTDFALKLGPTRHAYFNVRVADTMIVANGGQVVDDRGMQGGADISGEGARWVDFSGPVGGGAIAGATVIAKPQDGREPFWFVADWGVISVGPFRNAALHLADGDVFESRYTVLVHDGGPDIGDIAQILTEQ